MGQCTQKKIVSPAKIDFDESKTKLNTYKQLLTDEVHRMHMLSVLCKSESEYCMIKDNKYSSLVLMRKHAQISDRILILQKMLKNIDDSNNSLGMRHSKKLQLLIKIEKILKEKESCLFKNNITEIIDQDPKVMKNMTESLLSFNTAAEAEVEINSRSFSKSIQPNGIRRKYIRTEFKSLDFS